MRKIQITLVLIAVFVFNNQLSAVQKKFFEINLWGNDTTNSQMKNFDIKVNRYKPSIRVYLPTVSKIKSKVILLCPGGGYSGVVLDNEGYNWAPYFNEMGIALVVLKYRMPNSNCTLPSTDAYEAIRVIKAHAKEWNINPDEIGIMGASAGGHLASTVATHAEKKLRPAFQILIYPVITMNSNETHAGSRLNLLGNSPSKELEQLYSNELQVNDSTPPAFIALSSDDSKVKPINSINYYLALLNHKVPAAMFIYPTGEHGWGMKPKFVYHKEMLMELQKWIASN